MVADENGRLILMNENPVYLRDIPLSILVAYDVCLCLYEKNSKKSVHKDEFMKALEPIDGYSQKNFDEILDSLGKHKLISRYNWYPNPESEQIVPV